MFKLNRAVTVVAVCAGMGVFALPVSHAQTMPGPGSGVKLAGAAVGTVVDSTGAPVAQAGVVLINHEGVVVRKSLTGELGFTGFKPLKPGPYKVVAGKKGVGKGEAKVLVMSQEVAKFKVELGQ